MPFEISEFRRRLEFGGARPNLFVVFCTPPSALNLGGSIDFAKEFTFLCRTASLPASTLGMIEVPYMGRKVRVAGDRTFEDGWSTTIMNTEDFNIRNAMESWVNQVQQTNFPTSSPSARTLDQYQTTLTVIQIGKDGAPKKGYHIRHAFPTNIGAIELDWETTDTIETFEVTWSYSWFEEDPTMDLAGIAGNLPTPPGL